MNQHVKWCSGCVLYSAVQWCANGVYWCSSVYTYGVLWCNGYSAVMCCVVVCSVVVWIWSGVVQRCVMLHGVWCAKLHCPPRYCFRSPRPDNHGTVRPIGRRRSFDNSTRTELLLEVENPFE